MHLTGRVNNVGINFEKDITMIAFIEMTRTHSEDPVPELLEVMLAHIQRS
jgi:hypothetical protein